MPLYKPVDLKRSGSNRKLIAVVFAVTGIISLGLWWRNRDVSRTDEINSGWLEPLKISYIVKNSPTPADTARIDAFVQELKNDLDTTKGTYGIYVYRLNEKIAYGINRDEEMPAASIMKIPIMVGTYQAVSSGELEMTEEIKTLLTAMGKRSDNAAPVTLISKVGRAKMREAIIQLGMLNTDFDTNMTTASDVGEMWRRLYDQQILTSSQRQQMWLDLQDSIFEERIPAGVPENIDVVHKVGSDLTIWADSGIVLGEKPFVVVVMNKEVDLSQAKVFVPELVKKIYDFEMSSSN